MVGRGSERGNVALRVRYEGRCVCPKHVELILEINKTVIVASRWFLYYLTYIDDVRSNTNQVENCSLCGEYTIQFLGFKKE